MYHIKTVAIRFDYILIDTSVNFDVYEGKFPATGVDLVSFVRTQSSQKTYLRTFVPSFVVYIYLRTFVVFLRIFRTLLRTL